MSLKDCIKQHKLDKHEKAILDAILLSKEPDAQTVKAIEAIEARLAGYTQERDAIVKQILQQGGNIQERLFDQPKGDKGQRGSFRMMPDRKVVISLFSSRDLSTFLHESGHLFLEIYGDIHDTLANQKERTADQQAIVDDYQRLLKYLGVDHRDQITVEKHEKFARSYEKYLSEGKAPSANLRGAFAKFRSWLTFTYRNAKKWSSMGDTEMAIALDVNLTDEMRGVFDRMIATEQSIDAAIAEYNLQPMFTRAEDAGMTEEEFKPYAATVQKANDLAKEAQLARLLKEYRKQHEADWKEVYDEIASEVEAELKTKRAYITLSILQEGVMPDGTPVSPELKDLKINKKALDEFIERNHPDEEIKLPKNITSKGGNKNLDVVAELLGYKSIDSLILELAQTPSLAVAVRQEAKIQTDQIMGNMLIDGTLETTAVIEAMENSRDEVIEAEMAALKKKINQVKPFIRAERQKQKKETAQGVAIVTGRMPKQTEIREIADNIITQQKVRDLRPNTYLIKQRQEAANAARFAAKNEYEAAYVAKYKQRLNIELYKSSLKALERAQRIVLNQRRYDKAKLREKIGKGDPAYLTRIDEIREDYEFKTVSGKRLDARASLRDFVDRLEKQGTPHSIPPDMIDDARKMNYKELTVGELQALHDTLKSLEHLAIEEYKLQYGEQQYELEVKALELADLISNNLKDLSGKVQKAHEQGETKLEAASLYVRDFVSSFRDATTLLQLIDNFEDMGPAYMMLKYEIDKAIENNYMPRLKQEAKKLLEINKQLEGIKLSDKIAIQSLRDKEGNPRVFSRESLIVIALNTGTQSNLDALLADSVSGFTGESIIEIKEKLSKKEWQFVESVWRYFETYRAEIKSTYERRTGVSPEMIESIPVITPFGEIEGGYFPLKYDRKATVKGISIDIETMIKDLKSGVFSHAMTKHGFAKERIGSGGLPISLNINTIAQHMNEVLYDLTVGDAIRNTGRLLNNKTVISAFNRTGNAKLHQDLDLWLHDVALGELHSSHPFSKMLKHLRAGAGIAYLGFSASTALMQFTGIGQSIATVGAGNVIHGMAHLFTNPWFGKDSLFKRIADASPMMAERQSTFDATIGMVMEMTLKPGVIPVWFKRLYFIGMVKTQWVIDVITWIGAQRAGLKKYNGDVIKANEHADYMVKTSQGSGMFKDKSAIERGTLDATMRQSEMFRIWTAMMTYFIRKINRAYILTKKTDFASPSQIMSWAANMTLLFAFEAIIVAIIKGKFDKDEDWGDRGKTATKEVLKAVVGSYPILREVVSQSEGFGAGGTFGSGVKATWNASKAVLDSAGWLAGFDTKVDKKDLKDIITFAGIVGHVPGTAQLNRIIEEVAKDDSDGFSFYRAIFGQPPK